MKEYVLIVKTVTEAQRASTVVDAIMDRESGQLPLFYRLESGLDIPFIDTGYLSQRGLQSLKKRYKVAEKRGA